MEMDSRERTDYALGQKRVVDVAAVSVAVRELLVALGEDPDREGIIDTPDRVARFYQEFLSKQVENFTTFKNESQYHEIVCVRDIEFTSLCEHHLLPFQGRAAVAYVPGARIAGLSKLARVVDMFAGALQLQEQITNQVATYLMEALDPTAVGVRLEATHNCMAMRGVKKAEAVTVTQAFRGASVATLDQYRAELISVLSSS